METFDKRTCRERYMTNKDIMELIDKAALETKCCGIEFPYFGASYPDARCIDGYLWDMDSGEADENGVSYSYGGNGYPCPVCNTKEWLEQAIENEEFETKEDALVYVEQLKKHYL